MKPKEKPVFLNLVQLDTASPWKIFCSLLLGLCKFGLPLAIFLICLFLPLYNLVIHRRIWYFDNICLEISLFFIWVAFLAPAIHEFAHISNGIVLKGRSFIKEVGIIPGKRIFVKSQEGTRMVPAEYVTYLVSGVSFSLFCLFILFLVLIIFGIHLHLLFYLLLLLVTTIDLIPCPFGIATDGSKILKIAKKYHIRLGRIISVFFFAIRNVFKYIFTFNQYKETEENG